MKLGFKLTCQIVLNKLLIALLFNFFFCLSIIQFEQGRKHGTVFSVFQVLLMTSHSWGWKLGEGLNKSEGDVNKLAKDLVWSSGGLACSLELSLPVVFWGASCCWRQWWRLAGWMDPRWILGWEEMGNCLGDQLSLLSF